ncbi:hypothetical protein KI387_003104, partial [Taxus chinensis]
EVGKNMRDSHKIGTAASMVMVGFQRRRKQLPNLDLSLSLPRETLELLNAPQQIDEFNVLTRQNAFYFRKQQEDTQLTIFYQGTVHVYNVSPGLGNAIMVLANEESNALCPNPFSTSPTGRNLQLTVTPKA